MIVWLLSVAFALPTPLAPIAADRTWTVLTATDPRTRMREAGEKLGSWTIQVAGVSIDGPTLTKLADTAPDEPFVRVVREGLRRPFDVDDLLLFLDDVLAAGASGRRGEPLFVPAGRARAEGLLLHPQEVWDDRPRRYPERATVAVDEPPPQESFPVAADGDLLGPRWTMRYRSPDGEEEMWSALAAARLPATFAARMKTLAGQLRAQGAEVFVTSTVRYRERGYLMWGAHLLRGCADRPCVDETVTRLVGINGTWVTVPIVWAHPDGWEATREAARQMADAYDVVFATEKGARYSKHYDGVAADMVVFGLPRDLTLTAPDGTTRTFDLSAADEPRDLSLTPVVVRWLEAHWGLEKLRDDHPHWEDAAR